MTRAKTSKTPFEVPGQSGPAKPDRSGIPWSTRCALCSAPMYADGWRWLGRTRVCKGGCEATKARRAGVVA